MNKDKRIEVFDPRHGVAIYTTRFVIVAKLVCLLFPKLDWDYRGDGWIAEWVAKATR